MRSPRTSRLVFLVAPLMLTSPGVHAQAPTGPPTVIGRVTTPETGAPLEGVLLTLLDSANAPRAGAFTGANGRFTIPAPLPGVYRVRAEIVGRVTVTTEPFTLVAGGSTEQRIVAGPRVATLNAVNVVEKSACARAERGNPETVAVWEETSKALRAASFVETSRLVSFRLINYEREEDPRTGKILRQEFDTADGVRSRPFSTRSAAELSRFGYATQLPDEVIYHAPDHNAFLSAAFLEQHCLWLVPPYPPTDELIGLAFEPTTSRTLPDVRGTFWIDRRTSELRRLEYAYTGTDAADAIPSGGGLLEFQHLPSGAWIVSAWRIRMPVVDIITLGGGVRRALPTLIREAGGRVIAISVNDGRDTFGIRRED